MTRMVTETRGSDPVETSPEYGEFVPGGFLDDLSRLLFMVAMMIGAGTLAWKIITALAARMGPAWTMLTLQAVVIAECTLAGAWLAFMLLTGRR